MTDRMLVLIWIQTVWTSDTVPEVISLKSQQQKHEKLPSMQRVL